MNQLDPTEIAAFLQRFGGFEDGLIRKIEVALVCSPKTDPGDMRV